MSTIGKIRMFSTRAALACVVLLSSGLVARAETGGATESEGVIGTLQQQVQSLQDQIDSLGGVPGIRQVDCPTDSLQAALDTAVPGDVFQISGTCNETVVIGVDRVTLDGQGSGVIDGDGTSGSLVTVEGRNVTIKGLTIKRAASIGIAVGRSASAIIQGDTIEMNGTHGIRVYGGAYALIGATTDHATPGTQGNTIRNNTRHGILIRHNGSADIFHNVITQNGATAEIDRGINLLYGGAARIDGNQITDNEDDGINASTNASAALSNDPNHSESNIVTGNGRFGVQCTNEGFVGGSYDFTPPQQAPHASISCGRINLNPL